MYFSFSSLLPACIHSIASSPPSLSQGTCGCDHTPLDRAFNIATSVPYVAVGVKMLRNRETDAGRALGGAMAIAGASAIIYHASWGESFRSWTRKLDYYSIAVASTAMSYALFPTMPAMIRPLSYATTPFAPFKVSFVHGSLMELKFAQRAYKNKALRLSHRKHALTTAAGLACFTYECYKPESKYVHGAWHILSGIAAAQLDTLVADVERTEWRVSTPRGKGTERDVTQREGGGVITPPEGWSPATVTMSTPRPTENNNISNHNYHQNHHGAGRLPYSDSQATLSNAAVSSRSISPKMHSGFGPHTPPQLTRLEEVLN